MMFCRGQRPAGPARSTCRTCQVDLVVELSREGDQGRGERPPRFKRPPPKGAQGYLYYTRTRSFPATSWARPRRAPFDSSLTMASGNQVKVIGWYDNELGLLQTALQIDLAALVAVRLR